MPKLNDTFFIYGGQNVHVPAHLNFGKFMFDQIRHWSEKIALENTESEDFFTYKHLTTQTVNLSLGLTDLGMAKGDVVILGIDVGRMLYVPTALAVIYTGATLCPISEDTGRAILAHILTIVSPIYLICTGKFWIKYSDLFEGVKSIKAVLTFDDAPDSAIKLQSLLNKHCDADRFAPADVRGREDVAFLYFTSGTTGFQKAVQLTHLNSIVRCLPGSDNCPSVSVVAYYGLWANEYKDFKTFNFLANGKKIIVLQNSETESFLKAIDNQKVDMIIGIPKMIYDLISSEELLKKYNVNSLKIIYSSSAPLQKLAVMKIKEMFENGVEVYHGYGMTECGQITINQVKLTELRIGSSGTPLQGFTLKVVDPQTKVTLPPHKTGELCVKGDAVTPEYLGIHPSQHFDEDGFLKTGDLGYYDEDKYFYIVDRLNDIMIVGGFNVAPAELETILQLHPAVKDAGVVGKRDETLSEIPTAFVVKQPGHSVTEQELKDYVAAEVASYMQLKGGVRFVSEIPRNIRGKISRRQLREILNVETK